MLKKIVATFADKDYSPRTAALAFLRSVLDGSMYDSLPYEFHEERLNDGKGDYIPLSKRKPSVRYNLSRLLVEDSVSLLFGEGRFPAVTCADLAVSAALQDVIDETGLREVMQEAALRGSVGSIAILMRVLDRRLFFDVMETNFLTPEWQTNAPDRLETVTERYKTKGSVLSKLGYKIDPLKMDASFWFQRSWDRMAENWYLPVLVGDDSPPAPDKKNTVRHNLGFVPIAWIKNLPGGSGVDGACTFTSAVETQVEIEQIMSQNGRGLKYSADPTLLLKEPAGEGEPLVRSSSEALVVSEGGDAKLLEIGGTASEAVIGYVRTLREMALETIHGNRSSADKVSAAQSGRALEMLHQPLIWLADKLRTTYGAQGLLPLMHMVVEARQKVSLTVYGEPMVSIPRNSRLKLKWPPWFHRTVSDTSSDAIRVATLYKNRLISEQKAVAILQDDNAVMDVEAEVNVIHGDIAAAEKRLKEVGAKVTDIETTIA